MREKQTHFLLYAAKLFCLQRQKKNPSINVFLTQFVPHPPPRSHTMPLQWKCTTRARDTRLYDYTAGISTSCMIHNTTGT